MASNTPSRLLLLPAELLSSILVQLVPNNKPLILPQSHPTTKALLALTRTCRATHIDAIRLLYTHCVHINTFDRVHQISTSLSYMAGRTPTHLSNISLPNSGSAKIIKQKMSAEEFAVLTAHPRTARLSSLPIIEPHICIVSLHIEVPKLVLNVAFEAFAQSLYNLFTLLTSNLRNLFIDLPLIHFYRERRSSLYVRKARVIRNMRCSLRSVIENLQSIEILWTTGADDLFHTRGFDPNRDNGLEVPVHLQWPKIQCLVIPNYRRFLITGVWRQFPPSLDTVVLLSSMYLNKTEINVEIRKCRDERKLIIYVMDLWPSPDGTDDASALSVNKELVVFKKVIKTGGAEDESLNRNWVKDQLWSGSFPRHWKVIDM